MPNGYMMPISSNENSASWFEFNAPHPDDNDQSYSMSTNFVKVEDDRTLKIIGHNRFKELTIGELYSHWDKLVTKYENIPMKKFDHANYY